MNEMALLNTETGEVTELDGSLLSVDADARVIGDLYRHAKLSLVDNVKHLVECGHRLITKKESLPHGAWLPWLEEQADVLGFSSDRTAQRLMGLALRFEDPTLASDLEPTEALQISKQVWGHKPHVASNSGENEWYTPRAIIDAARATMGGIDLDPASCDAANAIVRADRFYDQDTNGLEQAWFGRVWMNPPYAQPLISEFAEKAASEFERGHVDQACVLVNNATETEWFQRMLIVSSACCFLRGRVRFIDKEMNPSGAPLQGQAVLYFGGSAGVFAQQFASLGVVRFP